MLFNKRFRERRRGELRAYLTQLGVMFALLTIFSPAGAAENPLELYARPVQPVTLPDGRRINWVCRGKSGPTVILEAGHAASSIAWIKVQSRLEGQVRACAYDRAGMGFSDPGPNPRDLAHLADDLKQALRAARLKPPYILVGHSLGGLAVRYYASLHPDEVAGLVLVDPSSPRQDARLYAVLGRTPPDLNAGRRACLQAAERGELVPEGPLYGKCVGEAPAGWPEPMRAARAALRRTPAYHRTLVSEFETLAGADSDQIEASRRSFGAMPLIVLTAGKPLENPSLPSPYREQVAALLVAMRDEAAALSTRGENRLIPNSGHNMQTDDPDAVARAILEVAAAARARR